MLFLLPIIFYEMLIVVRVNYVLLLSRRPSYKWLYDNLILLASKRNRFSLIVSSRNDYRVVGFPFYIKLMLDDRGGFSRWYDRDGGIGDILPSSRVLPR